MAQIQEQVTRRFEDLAEQAQQIPMEGDSELVVS